MLSTEAASLEGLRSRESSGLVQHQQGADCRTLTGAGHRVVIRDYGQNCQGCMQWKLDAKGVGYQWEVNRRGSVKTLG